MSSALKVRNYPQAKRSPAGKKLKSKALCNVQKQFLVFAEKQSRTLFQSYHRV